MSNVFTNRSVAKAAIFVSGLGIYLAQSTSAHAAECRPIEALADVATFSIFYDANPGEPVLIKSADLPRKMCAFGDRKNGRYQVCYNARASWVLPSQFKFKPGAYPPPATPPPAGLPDTYNLGAVSSLGPESPALHTTNLALNKDPRTRAIVLPRPPSPPSPSGPCACRTALPEECL